ncbi:MAG: hypothetical protein ACXWCZ_00790 [Flavisolibacter sp.]
MKNLIRLIAVFMLLPVFVKAQTPDPELDYIKQAYSKEKKTIVDEYMGLDVQEGARFWAVYGDYELKREKLALERIKLIQDYVDNVSNLTDAVADKLAIAVLTNNVNLDKLNLDYYGKMKKAIGAVKAAKFMQLETYLQTSWRSVIQNNVPLIADLDKTVKD